MFVFPRAIPRQAVSELYDFSDEPKSERDIFTARAELEARLRRKRYLRAWRLRVLRRLRRLRLPQHQTNKMPLNPAYDRPGAMIGEKL